MPHSNIKTVPDHNQQPQSQQELLASVETELADVSFREPIVTDPRTEIPEELRGDGYLAEVQAQGAKLEMQNASIDRQWSTVTEAARRAILADPQTRAAAAHFTTERLDESLPARAIGELTQHDSRTARVARLADKKLGVLLALPAVPDALLTPDIRHAPRLRKKKEMVKNLADWKERDEPEVYQETLARAKRQVREKPGVTYTEKELVARRYRYARDVKMLGLMAELHDNPIAPEMASEGGLVRHELPSGTKMVMTAEAFESVPGLLDPEQWQARKQLKDRVYEVRVADQHFIMKERKTNRHMDVKEGGHRDGLTSEQEFNVAREFSGLGTLEQEDIAIRWEKPLGYVEFPDGYQFCLFESEPDLNPDANPVGLLEKEILKVPEQYQEEYDGIRDEAKTIYDERSDLLEIYSAGDDEGAKPLSFEEFAQLKAAHLLERAKELLSNIITDKGYSNSDFDGYALQVQPSGRGHRPTVESIGFDFEYYILDRERTERTQANVEEFNENGETARMYKKTSGRKMTIAASYAMMEHMGYKIPPKE